MLFYANKPMGATTSSVKDPRHLTASWNHLALVSSIGFPLMVAVMMLLILWRSALRAMAVRG
jgi:hypothetical protein